MRNQGFVAVVLSWVLLGCGNAAAPKGANAPSAFPGSEGPSESPTEGAPARQSRGYAHGSTARDKAAPAAPSSAGQAGAPRAMESEERALEPESDDRPGLATTWGETRTSHVGSAPFYRRDPQRPIGIARLFYNDEEGVRAMADASRDSDWGDSGYDALGGALTVRLLNGSGRPLPMLNAASRTYVVGQPGGRYVIEIHNNTGRRYEAVATVDGLDVIDGQPGSFEKRGYLVGAWATVEIDGFRRSMDSVAAFRFGSVRDSYAASKGDDRNVGVVGVAFFEEAGSRYDEREIRRRHDADPFPGRFAEPPPITY